MDSLVNLLGKNNWLAYSGGLDSHVLLHQLVALRKTNSFNIQAVYINHHVSPNANKWQQHCAQVCADLNVAFLCLDWEPVDKLNFEEQAREARYQLFADLMHPGDVLLTAHHQDDQAETLMLQLMRGAGPKGLAAMPVQKPFATGTHVRPFLNLSKEDLKKYALENNLNWIEDESNQNSTFSRNFLRNEIFPILKKRWPTVSEAISRSAAHCAEAQELLKSFSQTDFELAQGSLPNTLSVTKLLLLTEPRQKQVLRFWLQQQNLGNPSEVKMQQILQSLLLAKPDKNPHIIFGEVELRRYQDDLFAMTQLLQHDESQVLAWDLQQDLTIPNLGKLKVESVPNNGLRADLKNVSLRFRQGGETFQMPGRDFQHELKNLFQTWSIPPWLRNRIPLIYVQDKLAAVVGFYVADEFKVKEGEVGINVKLYCSAD